MPRFLRRLFRLALVVAAVAIAGVIWLGVVFERPGPLRQEATLVLPSGAGLDGIARRLTEAGIIDRPWLFRAGVRLSGATRRLKAGEYAFPAAISAKGAMQILIGGRTVVRRLTVPEGLTTAQVLALVDAAEGLSGAITERPDEGALLPETYYFSYGDGRDAVIARMRAAMRETLADLWASRAAGLPLARPEDALILASMVEKETGKDGERARIAGVFVNRLRRGMRLQSDPTVAYALAAGGVLDRPLTRADLSVDSPYNTYRVKGLPPGPIANPGREAIAAVLHPAATKALYFVADGNGGHLFARTLAEHNRNVALWRKAKRARQSD